MPTGGELAAGAPEGPVSSRVLRTLTVSQEKRLPVSVTHGKVFNNICPLPPAQVPFYRHGRPLGLFVLKVLPIFSAGRSAVNFPFDTMCVSVPVVTITLEMAPCGPLLMTRKTRGPSV